MSRRNSLNVAVGSLSVSMVQLPPGHTLSQPVGVQPTAAVAARFTTVPSAYDSLQSPGQLMPGPLTLPCPSTPTLRLCIVAGTLGFGSTTTSHVCGRDVPPAFV